MVRVGSALLCPQGIGSCPAAGTAGQGAPFHCRCPRAAAAPCPLASPTSGRAGARTAPEVRLHPQPPPGAPALGPGCGTGGSSSVLHEPCQATGRGKGTALGSLPRRREAERGHGGHGAHQPPTRSLRQRKALSRAPVTTSPARRRPAAHRGALNVPPALRPQTPVREGGTPRASTGTAGAQSRCPHPATACGLWGKTPTAPFPRWQRRPRAAWGQGEAPAGTRAPAATPGAGGAALFVPASAPCGAAAEG